MNKIYTLLILFLLINCSPQKKTNCDNKGNDLMGTWFQKEIILFNTPSHMVGPNRWSFERNKCQILISKPNPNEYNYKVCGNYLELTPIKGHEYQKWEYNWFLNKKFLLNKNDSIMVWSIQDTIQITFNRNL